MPQLNFRCTPEEKAAWDTLAGGSLTQWIKRVLNDEVFRCDMLKVSQQTGQPVMVARPMVRTEEQPLTTPVLKPLNDFGHAAGTCTSSPEAMAQLAAKLWPTGAPVHKLVTDDHERHLAINLEATAQLVAEPLTTCFIPPKPDPLDDLDVPFTPPEEGDIYDAVAEFRAANGLDPMTAEPIKPHDFSDLDSEPATPDTAMKKLCTLPSKPFTPPDTSAYKPLPNPLLKALSRVKTPAQIKHDLSKAQTQPKK